MGLIGRDDELAMLRAKASDAANGRGSCVFVLGGLGVGKTALALEVAREASEQRMQVLQGRAWSFDAGLAYAPLIEALGPALRNLEPHARQTLVDELPELRRLFTWLGPQPRTHSGDAALEKTRLFESVALAVERLAERSPLLLLVEDVHDADDSTLELLHYLMRGAQPLPLLILCTVRSGEARASVRVGRMMASLERAGVAHSLELSPLPASGISALAARQLGAEPADELVALLESRTHGVPLFVTALLSHLEQGRSLVQVGSRWFPGRAADSAVPPGLTQLFEELLSNLDPTERTVIELLAVAAEPTPHAILEDASEPEATALLDAVGALRRRGLVSEYDDDAVCYGIAHPLGREVIDAGLAAADRRAHHEALLRARERLATHDLARLARHYRGVGADVADPNRALEVLLRAAAQARDRLAHGEAAQWLSAALPLLRAGTDKALLPRVLEDLGGSYATMGEVHAGLELWLEAVALYERRGDKAAGANLRSVIGSRAFEAGRHDLAKEVVDEGIAALESDGPSSALAKLYVSAINLAIRCDDLDTAHRLTFALCGPEWKSVGSDTRHEVHMAGAFAEFGRAFGAGPGQAWWIHFANALAELERAEATASTIAQRLRATFIRTGSDLLRGHHRAAEAGIESVWPLLDELGDPALWSAFAIHRGDVELARGRLREAMLWMDRALASSRRAAGVRALCNSQAARARVLAEFGDHAAAEDALAEALEEHDLTRSADRHVTTAICIARARVELRKGAFAAGLKGLEPLDRSIGLFAIRLLRAELLVGSGEPAAAERLLEPLTEGPAPSYPRAWALRIAALARQAAGDVEAARTLFDQAVEDFAALQMPLEAAMTRLERADASGKPTKAAIDDAQASLDTFRECQARPGVDAARRVLRRLGVKLAPERRGTSRDPLSAREREVAELAAAGLTNAEIAKQLCLSPHTIATHIKRIYARLSLSSRRELAVWIGDHPGG